MPENLIVPSEFDKVTDLIHHSIQRPRVVWSDTAVSLIDQYNAGLHYNRNDNRAVRVSNGHDRAGDPDQDGVVNALHHGRRERAEQRRLDPLLIFGRQYVYPGTEHRGNRAGLHSNGSHVHL